MYPEYWADAVGHLRAVDDVLKRVIDCYPDEGPKPRDDPFGTLARAIVGQQISVKAAASVWTRLEAAVGAVDPARIDSASDDAMLGCGLSRRKLLYLKDLAARFLSGDANPARWAALDDEAVVAELTAVKGIGRWTAEMFLIFHLMRPDVLPLDDIGLQRAMGLHYRGEGKLGRDDMDSIARSWQPFRSVAVWYLWRSLDPLPVDY